MTITDDEMRQLLPTTREYTLMILRSGPERNRSDADAIVWEHGRRNLQLRRNGQLAVVCPVVDGSEVAGVGIFSMGSEETASIMDEDPAGVFTYEVHPCRGFPGDALPA